MSSSSAGKAVKVDLSLQQTLATGPWPVTSPNLMDSFSLKLYL